MNLIQQIDLKFKLFFAEKNYRKAQLLSNEILNSLDRNKFPVYISLKNNETPYFELFEYYFDGFHAEINPNIGTLKILHNVILKLLSV